MPSILVLTLVTKFNSIRIIFVNPLKIFLRTTSHGWGTFMRVSSCLVLSFFSEKLPLIHHKMIVNCFVNNPKAQMFLESVEWHFLSFSQAIQLHLCLKLFSLTTLTKSTLKKFFGAGIFKFGFIYFLSLYGSPWQSQHKVIVDETIRYNSSLNANQH